MASFNSNRRKPSQRPSSLPADDAVEDALSTRLSRKQKVKIAVDSSLADGFSDPESISLRSGLPQHEIEAAMAESDDARSPSQRLKDSLREVEQALKKAYDTYHEKPHQGSANSISVLTRTRRDLIRDLESCRDPTDVVQGLDVRAIAPFIRAVITSSTSALSNAIDQVIEHTAKNGTVTAADKTRMLSNAIRAYGSDIDSAYTKMLDAMMSELGATAPTEVLESDSTVQQWAKPESRPRRRGSGSKFNKKRKGDDDDFEDS